MGKIGLMLEGGGMKCAYGAGVLDAFMENNITFDYIVGVSAGAANGVSLISGQQGRNRRFYVEHVTEPEYFGFRNLIKCGDMFNLKYIYGTLSNDGGEDEVDFDAFMANPTVYEAVATNALTGKPAYFGKDHIERNHYVEVMASSAIPVICRPVFVDGIPYYDGGISDALPYKRAFEQGCEKVVCILSKSRDYIRKPDKFRPVYKVLCRKYPKVVENIDKRYLRYAKQQKKMYELEQAGRIFIFSVESDLEIGTYTMDPEINAQLYRLGYEDFVRKKEALMEFMAR